MKVLDTNSRFRVASAPLDVRTEPTGSRLAHWFTPLIAALHETRRIQAEREIARYPGLLEDVRPNCTPPHRGHSRAC